MAALFPFPSSEAQIRAMSSTNWTEVPGGKFLASWSQNWRLLHIRLFFFHSRQSCSHQCTRFPQDWSEDLLTIPLGVLSNGPKFLSKSEGEPSGVGRRVAGLRSSQGDTGRLGFSISTTWYLRILLSDIHKWPLWFRSCFTWWLAKIVCPWESFKASSIRTAVASRFQRQGKISFQ